MFADREQIVEISGPDTEWDHGVLATRHMGLQRPSASFCKDTEYAALRAMNGLLCAHIWTGVADLSNDPTHGTDY